MVQKSLSYDAFKEELKEFLKSQKDWADYDLDASGIDTMISLMAYTENRMALVGAMMFNEAFLSTARQHNNIVKAAKALGYVPRSVTPAVANVRIVVREGTKALPDTLFIPKGTVFVGRVSGDPAETSLPFVLTETVVAEKVGGVWTFDNVKLVQGSYGVKTDVVDLKRRFRVYELPERVSLGHLEVFVMKGISGGEYERYVQARDFVHIDRDAKVFFVQEIRDGRFGIYFGESGIGSPPKDGSILQISYLITSGEAGNGYDDFSFKTTPDDEALNEAVFEVITLEPSRGGADAETDEEIRFNASHLWLSQNRAVTKDDYRALVLSRFTDFRDANVWGGEENDPPVWGKVFISLLPKDNGFITEQQREEIERHFRERYGMVSTAIEVVPPDYVWVVARISIRIDPSFPFFDRNKVASKVADGFVEYLNGKISAFSGFLAYSDVVATIDDMDESILASSVSYEIEKRVRFIKGVPLSFDGSFFNELTPGSLRSNEFEKGSNKLFLVDDGNGKLKVMTSAGDVWNDDAGSVDYETGKVSLSPILVDGVSGGFLVLSATPLKSDLSVSSRGVLVTSRDKVKVSVNA